LSFYSRPLQMARIVRDFPNRAALANRLRKLLILLRL
jgi:hypothetical protein